MDVLEMNINNLLVEIFNYILRFEEMSLKTISNMSVTVAEAHVLEAIGKQNKNATVSDIACELNIAVPTATIAVKKLERKGFVTKTSCLDDGRRFIISLTELGKNIYGAHDLFHKRMVKNVSLNLSGLEKEMLLSTLKKVNKFFKENDEA